jgi:PPK2 family polyphosphate:nucleotide phosphotransferase
VPTRHPEAVRLCRAATDGTFRLSDHHTDWVGSDLVPKKEKDLVRSRAESVLEENRQALIDAQAKLWANDTYGVLAIFQAMDAAGKDSTIKHVLSGLNPQGVKVTSYKVPSTQELDHSWLWRYGPGLPARGELAIFNRSYYEEMLVVRVHPEVLDAQQLPDSARTKHIWRHRFDDAVAFERHLHRNGFRVVKFFLNLSKHEQAKRFVSRIDEPDKNWKFSSADVRERGCWDDYQHAFQQMIRATSTDHAPWWVIPADRKWLMRALVSEVLVETIDALPIDFPRLPAEELVRLHEYRAQLVAEE